MTQTAEQTQTGTCACGATVTRPLPPGRLGELISRTPFACDACIAKDDERAAAENEAWRRDEAIKLAQQRVYASGLPAKHSDLVLDDMDLNDPAVAACRAWVDQQPLRDTRSEYLRQTEWEDIPKPTPGSGLLLSGPVGVGKTHLAAATTGTCIRRGARVHWMSGPLLFARLQAGIGTDEHARVLSVLTGRDALALDDLDKARPTAYGAENVFLAIDGRVNNLVPLIVTTNLSISELAQHWPEPYGEAIASRIAGYCRHIKLTGHDRRTA
jgi:DNA replication protein DnaC